MVDVIQSGEQAAVQPQRQQRWKLSGADAALRQTLIDKADRRSRMGHWSPSLASPDLACLLQVIESELLPRLLGEYRPANQAPLKTRRPG